MDDTARNHTKLGSILDQEADGEGVQNWTPEMTRDYLRFRIKLHEQDLINQQSLLFAEKLKKLKEEEKKEEEMKEGKRTTELKEEEKRTTDLKKEEEKEKAELKKEDKEEAELKKGDKREAELEIPDLNVYAEHGNEKITNRKKRHVKDEEKQNHGVLIQKIPRDVDENMIANEHETTQDYNSIPIGKDSTQNNNDSTPIDEITSKATHLLNRVEKTANIDNIIDNSANEHVLDNDNATKEHIDNIDGNNCTKEHVPDTELLNRVKKTANIGNNVDNDSPTKENVHQIDDNSTTKEHVDNIDGNNSVNKHVLDTEEPGNKTNNSAGKENIVDTEEPGNRTKREIGFDPDKLKIFNQAKNKRDMKKNLDAAKVKKMMDKVSAKASRNTNGTSRNLNDILKMKFDKDNNIVLDPEEKDFIDQMKQKGYIRKRRRRYAQFFDYGKAGDFEKFQEKVQEHAKNKANERHEIFNLFNESETVGYGENLVKRMEEYMGQTLPNFLSTTKSDRRKRSVGVVKQERMDTNGVTHKLADSEAKLERNENNYHKNPDRNLNTDHRNLDGNLNEDHIPLKRHVRDRGHIRRSKRNIDRPKINIDRAGENIPRSSRNIVRPKRSIVRPKNNIDRAGENIPRSKRNIDRAGGNIPRSKRNIDRAGGNIPRSKRNINGPKRSIVRPKRDIRRSKNKIVRPKRSVVYFSNKEGSQERVILETLQHEGKDPNKTINNAIRIDKDAFMKYMALKYPQALGINMTTPDKRVLELFKYALIANSSMLLRRDQGFKHPDPNKMKIIYKQRNSSKINVDTYTRRRRREVEMKQAVDQSLSENKTIDNESENQTIAKNAQESKNNEKETNEDTSKRPKRHVGMNLSQVVNQSLSENEIDHQSRLSENQTLKNAQETKNTEKEMNVETNKRSRRQTEIKQEIKENMRENKRTDNKSAQEIKSTGKETNDFRSFLNNIKEMKRKENDERKKEPFHSFVNQLKAMRENENIEKVQKENYNKFVGGLKDIKHEEEMQAQCVVPCTDKASDEDVLADVRYNLARAMDFRDKELEKSTKKLREKVDENLKEKEHRQSMKTLKKRNISNEVAKENEPKEDKEMLAVKEIHENYNAQANDFREVIQERQSMKRLKKRNIDNEIVKLNDPEPNLEEAKYKEAFAVKDNKHNRQLEDLIENEERPQRSHIKEQINSIKNEQRIAPKIHRKEKRSILAKGNIKSELNKHIEGFQNREPAPNLLRWKRQILYVSGRNLSRIKNDTEIRMLLRDRYGYLGNDCIAKTNVDDWIDIIKIKNATGLLKHDMYMDERDKNKYKRSVDNVDISEEDLNEDLGNMEDIQSLNNRHKRDIHEIEKLLAILDWNRDNKVGRDKRSIGDVDDQRESPGKEENVQAHIKRHKRDKNNEMEKLNRQERSIEVKKLLALLDLKQNAEGDKKTKNIPFGQNEIPHAQSKTRDAKRIRIKRKANADESSAEVMIAQNSNGDNNILQGYIKDAKVITSEERKKKFGDKGPNKDYEKLREQIQNGELYQGQYGYIRHTETEATTVTTVTTTVRRYDINELFREKRDLRDDEMVKNEVQR
ncbi:calponin homology domain-containing protein DDB_G0272472-like, partial [Diaphorina citri]|uniref:Calponin homology domain-containing protein DDB_G0272472-like n=1 Tax=Diaphorina citri TaxID=121845 RepID=A0A1S4EQ32_DIACI